MRSFLLLAILATVICVSASASAATLYVDDSVSSSGDGASWETAVKTIQQGVDLAGDGDIVFVAPGTYAGEGNTGIQFDGKPITLESRDGASVTAIDCEGAGRGFFFQDSGETSESVICGFTIKNGDCGVSCSSSSPSLVGCAVTRNSASGIAARKSALTITDCVVSFNAVGIDLYESSATVSNCTVSENYAGGIRGEQSAPMITYCTISENRAERGGGLSLDGLFTEQIARVSHSVIRQNTAAKTGGGVFYYDDPAVPVGDKTGVVFVMEACVIRGNSAKGGGGVHAANAMSGTMRSSSIANCIIDGNAASTYTGGGFLLGYHRADIMNCIVSGNTAYEDGGALHDASGPSSDAANLVNSILWGNKRLIDNSRNEILGFPVVRYCDVDGGWVGAGNISGDPIFLNAAEWNYRLHPDSPCIDGGTQNPAVVTLPETDIGGIHRIMYGGKALKVDIGAYEFHIWPPTENSQTGEMTLKWSSLVGKTYSIYHSSDMLLWDVLTDDVPSAGDTVTTWIDPPAPVLPPGVRRRYYKISENPLVTPSEK